jgi:ribosomal peptide maturation radical SAM protein 1
MYKISLINMPFAALQLPSIALTQLKSLIGEKFGDEVSIDVCYVNQDFAKLLSIQFYNLVSLYIDFHVTGIGDWLFRQSAFPNVADNSEAYFKRYYPRPDKQTQDIKMLAAKTRSELDSFMNQTINKYRLDQADLVGFTSMFTQNMACFALARAIKQRNSGIVTVMGGANCESPMGQEIVKNVPQLDYVFSGPALRSFPEFIQYQITGEVGKSHNIPGVFSKKNCALTPLGCGGAIGEEMPIDSLVKLDYEPFLQTIEKNFPNDEITPSLLFETSRGCWWGEKSHCTFCGLNGASMKYRSMSPENAIAQFNELFKYTGRFKELEAVDNILPKSYIKDLFPHLNTPSGVKIFYEVKADLSAEDLEVMSKAGVRRIQPGIESLSSSTLKLMAKGTNAFINLLLLKRCIEYDIQPGWNLLVGFPGETDDTYKKYINDLPLLAHLPPPSGASPVRFDRFSPYFTKAKQYELDLRPLDYYRLTYPFGEGALTNLAYYFSDANIGAKYFVTMAQWIDKLQEQIQTWNVRWRSQNRPKLFFKENSDGPLIYDSRFSTPIEHRLSEVTNQILEFLNRPRRITDITARMSSITGVDIESEIALLKEKGLIFHEDGRYLNIVLSGPKNEYTNDDSE